MSLASAVYHSCRILVHRCLVSDGGHAVSTVWSTAQPSGQQWEHAEAQVSPLRTWCVGWVWEPMCEYVVLYNSISSYAACMYKLVRVCDTWHDHMTVGVRCVCVCISSLVLIDLHSSCTHACFPQDGNTSKWKMKEVIPEREKCGSVEDCKNTKQSGRKQRVKIPITVIACTVSIPLFLSLFTRLSLSLSLPSFCTLPLTHWRMLTHQVPWLPSMGWCHSRWHHHAVYVYLYPPPHYTHLLLLQPSLCFFPQREGAVWHTPTIPWPSAKLPY